MVLAPVADLGLGAARWMGVRASIIHFRRLAHGA
jgi:hypothetical protein